MDRSRCRERERARARERERERERKTERERDIQIEEHSDNAGQKYSKRATQANEKKMIYFMLYYYIVRLVSGPILGGS